jgi:hypothetical protein
MIPFVLVLHTHTLHRLAVVADAESDQAALRMVEFVMSRMGHRKSSFGRNDRRQVFRLQTVPQRIFIIATIMSSIHPIVFVVIITIAYDEFVIPFVATIVDENGYRCRVGQYQQQQQQHCRCHHVDSCRFLGNIGY